MKERNYLFDNLKFLLIVLVVFGHSLEEISLAQDYAIIRAWIYSFHMPAFVFISGYFSKSVRRGEGARKQLLIVQYRTLYLTPFLRYVLRKR